MTEAWIRDEIRKQLNVIMTASSGSNDEQKETVNNLFPGTPGIPQRPVMHPYGFVSRAKAGVTSVIARIGEHFGNRMVIGHRDDKKPTGLDEGEASVYSFGQFEVRLKNDKVQVGKGGDLETAVVGETMVEFLTAFLDHYVQHQHISSVPGSLTLVPFTAATAEQLKSQYLTNEKVLAKTGGRY